MNREAPEKWYQWRTRGLPGCADYIGKLFNKDGTFDSWEGFENQAQGIEELL